MMLSPKLILNILDLLLDEWSCTRWRCVLKEATYQQCSASFEALCMARNQVIGHLIDNVSWPLDKTVGEKILTYPVLLRKAGNVSFFFSYYGQLTLSPLLVIQFWLYNSLADAVTQCHYNLLFCQA